MIWYEQFGIFERNTLNSSERFRVTRMVTSILSWATKNCQLKDKNTRTIQRSGCFLLLGAVRHSRRRAHGQTQKPSVPNGIVRVVTLRTQLVWWTCRRRGGRSAGSGRPRTVPCCVTILLLPSSLHNLFTRPGRIEKAEERTVLRNTLVEEVLMWLGEIREHRAPRGQTQSLCLNPKPSSTATSNATTQV